MAIRNGWKKLLNVGNAGHDVYIALPYYPVFKELEKIQKSNYHLTELYRAIYLLNADARRGESVNLAGNIRTYSVNESTAIEYYIDNGDVLIDRLYFDKNLGVAGDETTGLYRAKYNFSGNVWQASAEQASEMNTAHKWGNAHYAAIAGKFDKKSDASDKLSDHIFQSYGKNENQFSVESVKSDGKHYSLYWIQKGDHTEKSTVEGLTSLIQQNASKNAEVHWLVHGEGAKTFVQSAETLKLKPSLGMMQKADDIKQAELAIAMKKQQVYFSNPVGVTDNKLKQACTDIGVEFKNINNNPRNLKQGYRTAAVELSKKAVTYGALGATGTSVLTSETALKSVIKIAEPLASTIPSMVANPTIGSIALGGATAAAAFFAGQKGFKKIMELQRMFRTTFSSTFGKGNQYWYENDEEFLKSISNA